jgi:hypothetical protein
MKVITQEAIEAAQASVRSLLAEHCPVDDSSMIRSLLVYDESTGQLVLRPNHVKHKDAYAALHGDIQESCSIGVKWTEIDDPTDYIGGDHVD